MTELCFCGVDKTQESCLGELCKTLHLKLSASGTKITVRRREHGLAVSFHGGEGAIEYSALHHFSRCVSILVEKLTRGEREFDIEESPCYSTLGLLLDCSRNAIVRFDTFCDITRRAALMGYSMLQLYTEDTYELSEYPYFGYMRPRLNRDDIKKMDGYARLFGIELVPCIQTLAHLGQFLKWDASAHMRDFKDVLLVDEPKTYEFLEVQFKTISECYTSRRINIGLDEAFGLGRGKFRDLHGYEERFSIMARHCERVFAMARKYGLRPMLWSDMFFRDSDPQGRYYHIDKPVDERVKSVCPDDADLIYWDYDNTDEALVDGMLKLHHDITPNVIFASGAWRFVGFAPNNRFSQRVAALQHKLCRAHGISEVLVAVWGDNGAPASPYSVAPSLQYWAELNYRRGTEDIRERFRTCMEADYDAFMSLDMPNIVPEDDDGISGLENPGLYLLYQDVLLGLFDRHVTAEYAEHYEKWARKLKGYAENAGRWQYIFELVAGLCNVLALKSTVGVELKRAYDEGRRERLYDIAENVLPEIMRRMTSFHGAVTRQWKLENQAIGLDSLDIKLGGVEARLRAAKETLDEYLNGKTDRIEELERERLPFRVPLRSENPITYNDSWVENVTANVLY